MQISITRLRFKNIVIYIEEKRTHFTDDHDFGVCVMNIIRAMHFRKMLSLVIVKPNLFKKRVTIIIFALISEHRSHRRIKFIFIVIMGHQNVAIANFPLKTFHYVYWECSTMGITGRSFGKSRFSIWFFCSMPFNNVFQNCLPFPYF